MEAMTYSESIAELQSNSNAMKCKNASMNGTEKSGQEDIFSKKLSGNDLIIQYGFGSTYSIHIVKKDS